MPGLWKDGRASNVTVYCSGSDPRNNIGNWAVKEIQSRAQPGTKAFFTAKDIAMAESAELGLMLWDAKSTGTLSNVIELTRRGKKSVVFVNKMDAFTIIRDVQDLQILTDIMSTGAREEAEKKIGLSSTIGRLSNQQAGFGF
jgi:AAA+ superfamily predicted ATPase